MEPKKAKLTAATDVRQILFQNSKSPLAPQYVRWRLEQAWPDLAGKTIAENSRPANYIRGTLYLAVKHPVWIQQLQFVADELKKKVNAFAGEEWVQEIKFFLEDSSYRSPLGTEKDPTFGSATVSPNVGAGPRRGR